MAIAWQNNNTSNVASASQTTGIAITKPTGLADGDVMYALVGINSYATGGDWSCSGWTHLSSVKITTQNDRCVSLLRKVVSNAAGEPSSYTFAGSGSTVAAIAGLIVVFRDVSTSNPEDVTTVNDGGGSNDSTPDNIDITTSKAVTTLVAFHMLSISATANNYTIGAPSTFTACGSGVQSPATGTATKTFIGAAYKDVTSSGSQTIGSWTNTPSESTSEYATFAVALRPKPQTVTQGTLLTQAPTLNQPKVIPVVKPGLLSAASTLLGVTVKIKQTIGDTLLDTPPTVQTPKVNLKVSTDLLTQPETLLQPKLNLKVFPGVLSASDSVFGPTAVLEQFVTGDLLTVGETLYSPQVNLKISVDLLTQAETLFQPQVDLKISLETFSASAVLLQPTAGVSQVITGSLLQAPETLLQPQTNLKLNPSVFAASSSVNTPNVFTFSVWIAAVEVNLTYVENWVYPGVLACSDIALQPNVIPKVTPDVLAASPTFYEPQINLKLFPEVQNFPESVLSCEVSAETPEQDVTLDSTLDSSPTVLTPTAIPEQFVSPDVLEASSIAQNPVIKLTISLETLASPASFAEPELLTFGVDIAAVEVNLTYVVGQIDVDTLTAPVTLHSPQLNLKIQVPVSANSETLLSPSIVGIEQFVYPPVVSVPESTLPPSPEQFISPSVLTCPSSLLQPNFTIAVNPSAIDCSSSVNQPTVSTLRIVSPSTLSSASTTNTPEVTSVAYIEFYDAPVFDPPTGWESYTEVAIDPDGEYIIELASDTDYKLTCASTITGYLHIRGGRNIVWVGGHISISDKPADYTATKRRAIVLSDKGDGSSVDGRIIHIEGLLIDGNDLAEGINTNCPKAIVQLVNNRVEAVTIRGCDDRDATGVYTAGNHADVLQPWGGFKEIRVDGLTGRSNYQGFYYSVDTGTGYGASWFRRVNLEAFEQAGEEILDEDGNIDPINGTPVVYAGHRMFRANTGRLKQIRIDTSSFYLKHHPNSSWNDGDTYTFASRNESPPPDFILDPPPGNAVFSDAVAAYNPSMQYVAPTITTDGSGTYATFPDTLLDSDGNIAIRNWDNTAAGRLYSGLPVNGDYVPAALVGLGYSRNASGKLFAADQLYEPTVETTVVVAPTLLADPSTLHQPTVNLAIRVEVLSAPDAVLEPTVKPEQLIYLEPLSVPSVLLTPSPEQFVVPNVLDVLAELLQPTVQIGYVNIFVDVFDDNDTVLEPTVKPEQFVYTPVLAAPATPLEPSPEQFVLPAVLSSAATLLQPTLHLRITTPLLTASASVLQPEVQPEQFVTPDVLAVAAEVRQPTATATYPVTGPLLAASATVLTPTAIQEQFVTPGVLVAAATVPAPEVLTHSAHIAAIEVNVTYVSSTQTITFASVHLGDGTVLSPTVTSLIVLTPPAVSAPATILTPVLAQEQFVSPAVLSTAEVLNEPSVSVGQVSITPQVFSGPDSILEPALLQEQLVYPAVLSAASVLFTPSPEQFILTSLIASQEVLVAPTVLPGGVQVAPSSVVSSETVQEPQLKQQQFISPNVLDDLDSILDPTVLTSARQIFPDLSDFGSTILGPAVIPDLLVQPNVLVSSATLYAPSTVGYLKPAVLAAGATLGQPEVLTYGIVISAFEIELTYVSINIYPATESFASTVLQPAAKLNILPSVLSSASSVEQPKVNLTIRTSVLDSSSSTLQPKLDLRIRVQELDASSSILTPTAKPEQFVYTSTIVSSEETYLPTVYRGAVSVSPGAVSTSPILYTPEVAIQTSVAYPDLVTATSTVLSPTVSYRVRTPVVASTSSLLSPAVVQEQFVEVPVLVEPAVLFGPRTRVSVPVPVVSVPAGVEAPGVSSTVVVSLHLVISGSQVRTPAVTARRTVSIDEFISDSLILVPAVEPRYRVSTGELGSSDNVLEPRLVQEVFVVILPLEVPDGLFDPRVSRYDFALRAILSLELDSRFDRIQVINLNDSIEIRDAVVSRSMVLDKDHTLSVDDSIFEVIISDEENGSLEILEGGIDVSDFDLTAAVDVEIEPSTIEILRDVVEVTAVGPS